MSPFRPSGEHARWRILYEILQQRDVGEVVTYDEMGAALGVDPDKDRHTIQLAMRRAAKELEVVDKHATDAIPNEGYRIVEPEQHLYLAKRQQRKANRALQRGQSKVLNVDFNLVDVETRRAFEVVAAAFALQMDFNRRLDARQQNLEKAVAAVTKQSGEHQERTQQELEELRERLRRLEENRTSG